MIAFGFLILLIGLWVFINTFNGNLPGLVNIPGIHDATTAIRGLMSTAATNTAQATNDPSNFDSSHGVSPGGLPSTTANGLSVASVESSLSDIIQAAQEASLQTSKVRQKQLS